MKNLSSVNTKKNSIKFGTDGWRAIIAKEFTFDNLKTVVQAICRFLINSNNSSKGLFIGYDNRFLSEDFAYLSAETIKEHKIKPFLAAHSVPTPLSAFMAVNKKLNGSIMITASHNPSKYNGIKFISSYGGPAQDVITKEIETYIYNKANDNNIGNINNIYNKANDNKYESKSLENCYSNNDFKNNKDYEIELIDDFTSYKEKLISLVDSKLIKDFKPLVAIDTMHGASSKILPQILQDNLSLNVIVYNNFRDVLFGGKLPDPSEKNLEILKSNVIKNGLELGVGLDGDADRFGAVDKKGIFISPNNAIALILNYFIETKRFSKSNIAVRTVATTHLIDEICLNNGLSFKETPVGFKYIASEMLNGNVLIGGEESGGLSIKGHIPEKDGLLACLLLIEIQAYLNKYKNGLVLSDYLNQIYEKYGYFYNKRIDIEIDAEKKQKIIDYFANLKNSSFNEIKIKDVINIDGVKLIFEDKSWLLIRPSGTEPLIRCYIESKNKDYFIKMQDFILKEIKNIN